MTVTKLNLRCKKMKIRILFVLAVIIICTALAAFILAGCGHGTMYPRPPWPTDYSGIFSKFITDPADDLVMLWPDQPPYPVSYSPVDVTQVSLGVKGNCFYIRIEYVGVIPTGPVDIPEDPPVEAQIVGAQGTNVIMGVNNDGIWGDVAFSVGFKYGEWIGVYAHSDRPPGTNNYQFYLEGELGEGGPGHNYVIVRYNDAKLGSLFPRGTTVRVDIWSEAGSFDSSGNEFYHHFAFDVLAITTWTLPE